MTLCSSQHAKYEKTAIPPPVIWATKRNVDLRHSNAADGQRRNSPKKFPKAVGKTSPRRRETVSTTRPALRATKSSILLRLNTSVVHWERSSHVNSHEAEMRLEKASLSANTEALTVFNYQPEPHILVWS